jgi:uncharacterized protein (TIGR02118 family)
MIRLVILYRHPVDAEAFEAYYYTHHLPLAQKIPHVVRREVSRCLPGPDGSRPPYYQIAESWFNNLEELRAALASPEAKVVLADVPNYATGGVEVLTSEVTYESSPLLR